MIDCIALFIAADTGSPQASASAFRAPPFTKSGHSMMREHTRHTTDMQGLIFLFIYLKNLQKYISPKVSQNYTYAVI
jgi:hypothetical protein